MKYLRTIQAAKQQYLVSALSNYGFDVKFEDGIAYADYDWQKEKTPILEPTKSDINVLYTDIKVK